MGKSQSVDVAHLLLLGALDDVCILQLLQQLRRQAERERQLRRLRQQLTRVILPECAPIARMCVQQRHRLLQQFYNHYCYLSGPIGSHLKGHWSYAGWRC